MRAVLVSRYPRVDTPLWKRRVAESLLDAGVELAVLYSRASLADQARAGLRQDGFRGVVARYAALRGRGARRPGADRARAEATDAEQTRSLAEWAAERGIPVVRARRLDDDGALGALRALAPDLLVLAGADLVPAATLETPRLGTINPHYGLLPAYRGMNVTEWSVYRGDPVGVTVHLVDPGIDTGDILAREEIAVAPGETFSSLRAKHQEVAARLLVSAALALRDGTAQRTPQAPADGRQYFVMHPALRRVAERRLGERAAGSG
jgi:folate-dependent phosphoribosylglycinamide formyltransferase PurN